MIKLTLAAAIGVMLNGCGHHVAVQAPATERDGFAYREIGPDSYAVWLKSAAAREDMMKELCSSQYVCANTEGGTIVFIERKRK